MLSQYSWGQFFVFVLVLLVVYYLVVGALYYRDDLAALLRGQKLGRPQLAGVGPAAAGPPPLVRAKSAFAAPATAAAANAAEDDDAPADDASDKLPEGAAAAVGGELPNATASATGRDDGAGDGGPLAAAAAGAGATDEAVAVDADRQEQDDQPNEALAALIRERARELPVGQTTAGPPAGQEGSALFPAAKINAAGTPTHPEPTLADVPGAEPGVAYQPAVATGYEPLAEFSFPVAAPHDVAPVMAEELFAVDVAAYISRVQAGEQLRIPAALAGTSLAEQLAQHTAANTDELAELFGADTN